MAKAGENDYRAGARERLGEAFLLLRQEQFGGSIYPAGRAVEGMLRAVIWRSDSEYAAGKKTLDTGHNLREMLRLVRNLGALRHNELRESITEDVQRVSRLWWNGMRFLPTSHVNAVWYGLGEVGGRRTMKQATSEFFDACSGIIKRREALWQS